MIRICEAVSADAEALAALSAQLGYPADAETITRRLADIAARHAGVVLVAVNGHDEALGFAHALPQHCLLADPFVELVALVVAETARGDGIGAMLLRAVEAWARDHGFAVVDVHSNVTRARAHRFYLREGYAERKRQAVFVKRL